MADMIDILKTELANDPLGVGYAGKSDEEAADLLNSLATGRTRERESLISAEVYEAIDVAEMDALAAGPQARVDRVLGLGDGIDVRTGSKARTALLAVFGSGTTTRTNLASLVTQTISRAEELGIGVVRAGHVQDARRM